MKYIFLFFGILYTIPSLAQNNNANTNMRVETTREAQFPGGEEKLYNTIYYNLHYSEAAIKNRAEGIVMLSLFVEPDSTVSTVKILNDPGFACGDSVKSFLLKTKFIPALMNGTSYRTQLMLNIPVRAH